MAGRPPQTRYAQSSGAKIARCFRDIHAAGQHILFSSGRDQAYAKVHLGIDQPTYLI